MGLMSMLVAPHPLGGAEDYEALAHTAQTMATIDGSLDATEQALLEVLWKTVPQLKGRPQPTHLGRRQLLELAGTVESDALRKQCFVIAVEVALASGHVNESEDQFIDLLQKALRVELAFAREAIEVIACKYARGPMR